MEQFLASTLVRDPLAKKKAKTNTACVDEELIRMANVIAAIRNISSPDYLNQLLRPLIERDYRAELECESSKAKTKSDDR